MKNYRIFETILGPLTLVAEPDFLTEIHFGACPPGPPVGCSQAENAWSVSTSEFRPSQNYESNDSVLDTAELQLREYFEGHRTEFTIPWIVRGTEFQENVWRELATVPFGTTCSYGELARRVGRPRGARAIGMAMGRNPLPIVLPCHRVLGADGSLTGFGGGLEVKRKLLALERTAVPHGALGHP